MKILVIHATAGAGHKKAAEAVYHGLTAAGHDACLVDALDHTNPLFRSTYPAAYTLMVTRFSWAWKFFFALLDLSFLQPAVKILRRVYNGLNAQALERFMIDGKFDAIITTQFLSAEVSAYLRRSGRISSKIICVVTDFDVHRIWVNRGIDRYACASDHTRQKLISLGIRESDIAVTGIPTDAKFSQTADRAQLRARLGLRPDAFTVLIATGSFGMGPIEELIGSLKAHQLLIVCGHNKGLYERLRPHSSKDTHVFGLVDNMHELMTVADAMVTKPGGLSIAEALVKGLPMVFFSAIPGQETQNIKVLKKYGAGMDQMDIPAIKDVIDRWAADPQEFARARKGLEPLAKPNAVADIIKIVEHRMPN